MYLSIFINLLYFKIALSIEMLDLHYPIWSHQAMNSCHDVLEFGQANFPFVDDFNCVFPRLVDQYAS